MIRDKLKEKTIQKPGTFRFRGTDNTRIEALSDGVFALATALLVISTSIPNTYVELINFLSDLVPFTICIVLLMLIWYQHYVFFIRYGFKDATIVAINTFLLILILFYIYPLKFLFEVLYILFTAIFSGNQKMMNHLFTEIIPIENAPMLMIIYGFGAAAIFFTLAIMYLLAYRRREHLNLNILEVFDTKVSLIDNILMGSIPLLSAIISIVGYGINHIFTIAGFTYWLYAIVMPIFGTIMARKKRRMIAELENTSP